MIASGFAANGVRTYITARKAEACDAAAAELSAHGECVSIPADLSTANGLASFVATLTEREPQIDILVNNAGAAWGAPLGEFPEIGFDKVMDINVKAPARLARKITVPAMSSGEPMRLRGTFASTILRLSGSSRRYAIIFDSNGPGAIELIVMWSFTRWAAMWRAIMWMPAFDAEYE